MFGFLKKKTEIEKLSEQYAKLMQEAHKLWQSNRAAGDQKAAEAELVAQKIDELKKKMQ